MAKSQIKVFALIAMAIALTFSTACEKNGPIGPEGPQGEQGSKGDTGEPGNANVRTYSFSVNAAQWDQGYHYGDGNVFRSYKIPDEVKGISIREFFNKGGLVLAYTKVNRNGNSGYREWKITPHVFSYITGYENGRYVYVGIRIECLPNGGSLTICETTNGWDSKNISRDEIPEKIDFRIVLVEASVFEKAKSLINFSNYREMETYFELE